MIMIYVCFGGSKGSWVDERDFKLEVNVLYVFFSW